MDTIHAETIAEVINLDCDSDHRLRGFVWEAYEQDILHIIDAFMPQVVLGELDYCKILKTAQAAFIASDRKAFDENWADKILAGL